MQITVQSVRVAKAGTSKQGDWELIAVKSQKGTEYMTFDKKVKHLGPGSVIDIGEPEEDRGKLKFKEVVEVVSEVAPAPTNGSGGGGYKRDTEGITHEYTLKARLQELQSRSIEAQTAFNGIIELCKHGVMGERFQEVYDKALDWAVVRLDEIAKGPAPEPKDAKAPQPKEEAKVKSGAGESVDPEHPFPNVGALLTWCAEKGISREQFLKLVEVEEAKLSNLDLAYAHNVIRDYLKQQPDKVESEIFD